MRKIPTLFKRDPDDMKRVLPEVTPNCQWVFDGAGIATRKYDGTCIMWDPSVARMWLARREVKPGKNAPEGFIEVDHDETTGKSVGWVPAEESSFVKQLREAIDNTLTFGQEIPVGTYELCGPKINGNPEEFTEHRLIRHGADRVKWLDWPTDFDQLRAAMITLPYEGIVWHHMGDDRMAKLKRRDFPAPEPPLETK